MQCKKCKEKDELIERYKNEGEKAIKLNREIIDLARSVHKSNSELITINKILLDRVENLENKLKEATSEVCSSDSDNA